MMSGDDRYANSRQVAALAEVVKIEVGEVKLCADVVGAGIHLALEVVHFLQAIGRARVPLGKAGDADSEAARIRRPFMRANVFGRAALHTETRRERDRSWPCCAAGRRPRRGCSRWTIRHSGRGSQRSRRNCGRRTSSARRPSASSHAECAPPGHGCAHGLSPRRHRSPKQTTAAMPGAGRSWRTARSKPGRFLGEKLKAERRRARLENILNMHGDLEYPRH